jgi:isoleucyl-tRNA synthetase
MPAVRAAILALDLAEAVRTLLEGKPVEVNLDGERLEVLPEEVEVRASARSGLTVASEGAYLCALTTQLTPELVDEGLAREFVRRVQDLRKQADFDIADRIHLYYRASPRLAEAIQAHRNYIMGETLSVEMSAGSAPEGVSTTTAEFDGEQVTVDVRRVAVK